MWYFFPFDICICIVLTSSTNPYHFIHFHHLLLNAIHTYFPYIVIVLASVDAILTAKVAFPASANSCFIISTLLFILCCWATASNDSFQFDFCPTSSFLQE